MKERMRTIDRIKQIISTNYHLSGLADLVEGDLCPEDYFRVARPLRAKSILGLYRAFKKWDNGIFLYRNILIVKHWNYGAYVFDLTKAYHGSEYFEHLNPDIGFESFKSAISQRVVNEA